MPVPDPIVDSQGTTFSFNSVDFLAKNVKVKTSRALVDVTPLSQASGTMRKMQPSPLQDGTVITCEYFGTTAPSVSGSAALPVSCAKLGISGNAYCEDFELTAAVGELVMGNLTLKMSAT